MFLWFGDICSLSANLDKKRSGACHRYQIEYNKNKNKDVCTLNRASFLSRVLNAVMYVSDRHNYAWLSGKTEPDNVIKVSKQVASKT